MAKHRAPAGKHRSPCREVQVDVTFTVWVNDDTSVDDAARQVDAALDAVRFEHEVTCYGEA